MWLVLSPVHEPIPIETSDPIPAASRPGSSTSGSFGPPIPVASIRSTAAISGEPNRNETAANVPAAAEQLADLGRRVRLGSGSTPSNPSPPPSAISGASGPSTSPRPIEASAARMTPGSSIGWVGAAFRPVGGQVPAGSGQPDDRKGGHQAGDRQHRERPPHGDAVEPELVREVV